MLRPSFFIFISLISSICHGYTLHGPLKSPTTVSSNSTLSPDYYEGRSPKVSSFALVDFQVGGNYYQVSLRLEDWQGQTYDECTFNVTTRWPVVKVGVTSLRLLMGDKKVVLSWYDEVYESESNVQRRPHIVGMDFRGCRSHDLGLQNLLGEPIVLPVTTGGFEVYLADPVYCERQSNKRCEVYYNVNFLTFYDPIPFDIDLDWSTLQLEHTLGLVLYRGFDNSRTYRVFLTDYGNDVWPIVSWNNADSRIAVVTSTWALCWVENPSVDTAVNCSQFDRWGKIIYSKITEFGVPVTPLAVKLLKNGRFFLLTGQTSCSDKTCWQLTWTIVSDNSTSAVEEFDCTGDRKSLVVSKDVWQEDGSLHYWYTCKNESRYVYNENHIKL